jgi:hypothetical protein
MRDLILAHSDSVAMNDGMRVSESVVPAYQKIGSGRCCSCSCHSNESDGGLVLLARLKQALQRFRMERVAAKAIDVKGNGGSTLSLKLEDRWRESIQSI